MSQDSLDVLADVLQAYICKVGKTMAYLVESSGRPSSHTNALDALQAIHMTTAPAANQVHLKTDTSDARSQRVAPWHDLAVFCFGPKWEGEKVPLESRGHLRRIQGMGGRLHISKKCLIFR